MIKYKLQNIISFLAGYLKKIGNKLRYSNLKDYINPAFGNSDKLIEYNQTRATGPEPCVCHAPLRSLYFDIHGKATACCFNRAHILGTYPNNTISEIVNGDKRGMLQTELCRQNFMYGCQHCHKLIEAGNFDGVEARLYDNLKDRGNIPTEIVFELDNTCNLECVMCHGEFSSSIAKTQGLSKIKHPYDENFLIQLSKFIPGLKVAKFLGGEPFLISIYYEVWDLIIKLNPKCKINLQTNGTVFNEKVKSYLERGNFYIGISVDSLVKETFESIRKNADFATVMENVDKFIAISRRKNNYVNISVCPMQQNWTEIPNLVEFCNSKNVFIYFNTVYTRGFAISELGETKLLEILNFYKSQDITAVGVIAKRNKRFFENLISNIESWYNIKEMESRPMRKRHLWNANMLKTAIVGKYAEDEKYRDFLNRVFDRVDKQFYFSDADIESLKKLDSQDVLQALNSENEEKIFSRIQNFIATGRFGE